jgi:hypothetical protein
MAIVATLALLYVLSAYTSLFEERVAIVYHLPTDSLYKMTLLPGRNPYDRWQYLIPLRRRYFTEVASIDFEGFLSKRITERALREQDFEAWLRRTKEESERVWREIEERARDNREKTPEEILGSMSFRYGYYLARRDLKPVPMVPKEWQEPLARRSVVDSDLVTVDFVVMTLKGRDPVEVQVLHGALLIQGTALAELQRDGWF